MNKDKKLLNKNEPVEVEDYKKMTDPFGEICGTYLELS